METLQRECQRQYMESMGLLIDLGTKPKVESIEGLSPAISISQQITNRNPRSTVGTITELAPYLRVLFSKIGERPSPDCGTKISGVYGEDANVFLTESDGETEDDGECLEQMVACPTCKGVGMGSLPNVELLIDRSKSEKC